jgi:Tol biopolymer transport system component
MKWRQNVTAFAVAMTVVGAMLIASPSGAGAVAPGADGKIAFARANQVYTINASGSGVQKLTFAGKNYWPRWSPDGKRIAYIHEESGHRDVWVMRADGSGKQRVTTGGNVIFGPAWSPDGRSLALSILDEFLSGATVATVRSTAPFGTPVSVRTFAENPADPDMYNVTSLGTPTWSTAGIAVQSYPYKSDGESAIIGYVPATSVTTTLLVSDVVCCTLGGRLLDPGWSPDATRLTYTLTDPTTLVPKVYVAARSASGAYAPVPFATVAEDEQLAFSPSGTKVVLMNDSTGTPRIIIANPNGSSRRVLTTGYQADWQPRPA